MNSWFRVFWSVLLIQSAFTFPKGNLKATQLDPITVSGAGLEQRLSKTFSNISIFNREDIEQSGVKSLADLLQNRSSVQVGRNGGLGAVTSFFLRGSESRNVLVLLNGVRLRDELTQSSLAENIPLDLIERIEVVPGNMSSVYGEGAIGGVINISTTKASYNVDERANKLVRLETGSYGNKNISFNIETPVDDSLTALISGNLLQTNGFSATNPTQTFSSDPTDYDKDKHKNETINISFLKRLKNGSANLIYFKTDSETFFDNSFFGNNPKQNSDQEQINFVYNLDFANDNTAQISFDSSKIKLRYNYGQFFVTKEDKVAFQNDIRLDDDSNLLLGVEKRSVSRNPSSSGIRGRDFESVFIAYVGQRGPVSLQANLRNDNTNRFKSRVTYLMGFGYSITPGHTFNLNHSTGFVSPNAYALSTNSEVLPEEHEQFEAGYTFLNDSLMFRMFYFDTKTNNPITYDPADGYKAKNFSHLHNSGFEVSLKNISDIKNFDVSFTFQNPQSPDGLNPSTLIQSARRANFFGSIGFSLKKNRYGFSIRGTGSSGRKDSDYSAQNLPKYFVINSSVKYKLNNIINFFVTMQNITNKRYQLAYGYNTMPQQFTIGVNANY
ncbi:TonB-dependent receptor [Betaproteobacteria bacterium]|nr:TonB-dependent receptor [Betaproteobacteria bacterium]